MKQSLLRTGKVRIQFRYQVTTTGAAQSTTPKFTFAAGAPAAVVDWGDGSALSAVTSGVELNHAYAAAGTYTVRLIMPAQHKWVTQIDISADKVTGDLWAHNFRGLRALERFYGFTNAGITGGMDLSDLPDSLTHLHMGSTSCVITGSLADLPDGFIDLYVNTSNSVITGSLADLPNLIQALHAYATGSVITGSLADLPDSMQNLALRNTNSVITGALADLPAGLRYLYLQDTLSTITGGGSVGAAGLEVIRVYNLGLNETTVDEILASFYASRAAFTYATPALQIHGTNAAPTGAYADEDPPTTGLGYVYELANDPEAEGFNTWSITYTGGTAP